MAQLFKTTKIKLFFLPYAAERTFFALELLLQIFYLIFQLVDFVCRFSAAQVSAVAVTPAINANAWHG